MGHYYAHPGNRFWRAIHEVGITPRQYQPHEFPSLLDLRIGFTDMCKTGAGMDQTALNFPIDVPGFREKMQQLPPEDNRLHQQEGRKPLLWTADEKGCVGPTTT